MSKEVLREDAEYTMKDFEGIYVGMSPSDESAVGYGELEVTIASNGIAMRCATGLEIEEDFIAMDEVRELSAKEVSEIFADDIKEAQGMRVFMVEDRHFMFLDPAVTPESMRLIISGGMGDFLGPTALFDPSQVESGFHEKIFGGIEIDYGQPGDLPRLSTGGVAPNQAQ